MSLKGGGAERRGPAPGNPPRTVRDRASGGRDGPKRAGEGETRALPPHLTRLSELRPWAVAEHRAGRLDRAAEAYRLYLSRRPQDAGIWTNLGALLRKRGEHEAAHACQSRAHQLAPEDLGILNNLGNALQDSDRLEQALAVRRDLVGRLPDQAEPHANLAVTLRSLGRAAEALQVAEAGLARFPADAELRVQRAMCLLTLGDYAQGFAAFESRWEIGEIARPDLSLPEWRGEDLTGKRIMVLPEQGFGDTILMSRFLPGLKARGAAEAMLLVKPPLRRLFEGLPGVDRLVSFGDRHPPADLICHMMDLPRRLGVRAEALPPSPPLHTPADSRARAERLLAPFAERFKVGVCWTGSLTYKANFKRSFAADRLLPLAAIPGVQLISLYKGPALEGFRASGAGLVILDGAGDERDFADAAATLQALDLVITMDTAVAHLAGALGRPVWNLLHFSPFWLYGESGEATPWHPSMRLFRQDRPGDWDGVFARVETALTAEIARWRERAS